MLEIRNLEVVYSGVVQALRGINMTVGANDVVAVLGSNGAGKSTLLRTISGTIGMQRGKVTAGSLTFAGESLVGKQAPDIVRRGLVHVPEGRRVFGRLTVDENLRAGAATVRNPAARSRARQRVFELFPRLAERRDQRAALLSGGEQQMLAIGRALMSSPRMLLLDEPSLGLAPQVVGRIGAVIREINSQGTAVLLVEQNATMALAVANNAYVLELGRVAYAGPAAELRDSDQIARMYLAGDSHGPGHAAAGAGAGLFGRSGRPAKTLSRWEPPTGRHAKRSVR